MQLSNNFKIFPITIPAIRIEQPLGVFYMVSLPASLLLNISYSIKAEILEGEEEDIKPMGFVNTFLDKMNDRTQRETKISRLKLIKDYTETVDASFPNSVILGVNFAEDGMLVEDENQKWYVTKHQENCYTLTIPSKERLASIIDGQHRILGFKGSANIDMHLPCSIYLDLPMPYHAQIFTSINMNQQKVSRNLGYQLFQFHTDQGGTEAWSPETLAVYFTRVLAKEDKSPFEKIIKLGITSDQVESSISMASVVDGILSLISNNPRADREKLHKAALETRNRLLLDNTVSTSPLRDLYIHQKDKTLYLIINTYFLYVEKYLWDKYPDVLKKTIPVQAFFDVLRELAKKNGLDFDYTNIYFENIFKNFNDINFNDSFFSIQPKARTRLKNIMLLKLKMMSLDDIKKLEERNFYSKLLG